MATFLTDLMSSIFVPGPTPSIIIATNVSFAALQALLFALLVATFSYHFLILSVLCGGLWWSINWFVAELRAEGLRQAEEKERNGGDSVEGEGNTASDTEAETVVDAGVPANSGKSASKEVEVQQKAGELKVRANARGNANDIGESGTELSTEDEWEKVSENESEKDK